jgi:hypothetical protein
MLATLLTLFIASNIGTSVSAAPPAQGGPTPRIYLPFIVQGQAVPATSTPVASNTPTRTPVPSSTAIPTPQTPPPPSAGDWAMAAANPQRTSWTSEEVRGNLQVAWYHPIEPYIPYKVQPIAANGNIYVSTARGLYTFRAGDGALLWVYATELPLGNSPTIATIQGTSIAYVGGYDHMIHAINALSGQAVSGYTPYQAAAGFETNPLVINDSFVSNTILAGNRDGYFYALNAVTGALKWKYKTDGPILFSAAYKNGIVYFASNDMYAYALNASNGTLVWKSAKFPGEGFHSFWPVIYTNQSTGKDYISFTTGENYRNSEQPDPPAQVETNALETYNLPSGALPTTNSPVAGDWAPGTITLDASTLANYFANNSWRRVVFLLDAASGHEFTYADPKSGKPAYPPFGWSGITSAGTKYPGVVNGVDGVYYQQTAYTDYSAWVSRGAAVGWKFGTQYISKVLEDPGNPDTFASDEPVVYSSGGKLIYWAHTSDHRAGSFDITIPYGQPNRAWDYYGYNLINTAPNYDPMYNDGTGNYTVPGVNGWVPYSGAHQSKNGVYGKHGTTQSPPIPYQGKVFFLKGNTLLAFSPNGTSPQTPLALATIAPTQSRPTSPTTAELRQRLQTEVQKMIASGHLRPGYHAAGFIDLYGVGHFTTEAEYGEIFDYFQNPSDTVYTLLLAYPYLSSNLQSQVKTYLQNNYGPGATYDFTKIVHIGWKNGAPREAFDIPPEEWDPQDGIGSPYKSPLDPSTQPICASCGYWRNFPPFNFYAAWKYAQIVGNNDSTQARNLFNLMSSKIEAPPSTTFLTNKPYFINLYAAGYLGYLSLKQLAGLGGDATVQGYYNQMLSLRVNNFSKDTPYWNTDSNQFGEPGVDYNRTLSVARNFMFLTPEIADYMSQNIKSQVQTAVTEYNYVAPYWFVAGYDNSFGEGTFQHLYDYPALFQAKAYILKQPYDELVAWLDVPAFQVGDLFYIQNLVAALSANP